MSFFISKPINPTILQHFCIIIISSHLHTVQTFTKDTVTILNHGYEPQAEIYISKWTPHDYLGPDSYPESSNHCWQRLLTYSEFQQQHQTEISASCIKPCLFLSSGSTTAGKPWFCLSTSGLRPAPSNQNNTTCILICISIQTKQNCTIWKTHLC